MLGGHPTLGGMPSFLVSPTLLKNQHTKGGTMGYYRKENTPILYGKVANMERNSTLYQSVLPENPKKCTGHLIHTFIGFSGLEVSGIVVPFGKRTHKGSPRNASQGFITEGHTAIVGHKPFD